MQDVAIIHGIKSRYEALDALMDERVRRQWAAAEAKFYGWGGVRAVSGATGMSPHTIVKGLTELATRVTNPRAPLGLRLRKPGGGRKGATDADPELVIALTDSLIRRRAAIPNRHGDGRVRVRPGFPVNCGGKDILSVRAPWEDC
jgi:hypothetical protein